MQYNFRQSNQTDNHYLMDNRELAILLLDACRNMEVDNDGQIVIYTGLMGSDSGELVEFEPDDEE